MRISALVLAGMLFGAAAYAQTQPSSPSTAEFQYAMQNMHAHMPINYTGKTDLDFVNTMIPHHQGAVDMAKTELKYGTDPGLHVLAQRILDSQRMEITFMQNWRKNHPQ